MSHWTAIATLSRLLLSPLCVFYFIDKRASLSRSLIKNHMKNGENVHCVVYGRKTKLQNKKILKKIMLSKFSTKFINFRIRTLNFFQYQSYKFNNFIVQWFKFLFKLVKSCKNNSNIKLSWSNFSLVFVSKRYRKMRVNSIVSSPTFTFYI